VRMRVRRVLCKVEMGRGMNLAAGGREGKILLGRIGANQYAGYFARLAGFFSERLIGC
jgi:hypothetical protein